PTARATLPWSSRAVLPFPSVHRRVEVYSKLSTRSVTGRAAGTATTDAPGRFPIAHEPAEEAGRRTIGAIFGRRVRRPARRATDTAGQTALPNTRACGRRCVQRVHRPDARPE